MKKKTWRNPVKQCVCCLYRVGLGVGKIGKITQKPKSVCFKWVRAAGILDSGRVKAANQRKSEQSKRRALVSKVYTVDFMPIKTWVYFLSPKALKNRRAAIVTLASYHADKATHRARCYAWRDKNPANVLASKRKTKQRPVYKVAQSLRARLNGFVKRKQRAESTQQLVGCSWLDLISWLQSKFTKGMSWSNYGQWHIDHVVPCKAFDLTQHADQRRCFHYSNLQPLWASDNCRKWCHMPISQPTPQ